MSIRLDELKNLAAPPASVAAPPWEEAPGEIGFAFPADYREFVDTYGGGTFTYPRRSGAHVRAPHVDARGPNGLPGFAGFIQHHTEHRRPLFTYPGAEQAMWAGDPYPLYPDPGGLLFWGSTDGNDMFFWLTEGADPDSWPVVGWSRHDASTIVFEGGMVAFLTALLTGRIKHFGSWTSRRVTWRMKNDWLNQFPL